MKSILKWTAIFVLGVVIGGGLTAYGMNRFYKSLQARMYVMQVSADVTLAWSLRDGNAKIVLDGTDRRVVEGVLELSRKDDLKASPLTEFTLTLAKKYYTCTKTQFPPEINAIMNGLPPVDGSECSVPE